MPALVRVPGPDAILSVLDCGATGVLIPHVSSADYARKVAALCRYRGGKRGFATSTRAGRYTAVPMWRHIADSDASTVVVAQIEDPEALDEIDAIAAVDGVDSLFIGRGDLTAAFGDELKDPPARSQRGRAHFRRRAEGGQVDQRLCRQRHRGRLAEDAGSQHLRAVVGSGLPAPGRARRPGRSAAARSALRLRQVNLGHCRRKRRTPSNDAARRQP